MGTRLVWGSLLGQETAGESRSSQSWSWLVALLRDERYDDEAPLEMYL
jgi:hypothetical protein